MAQTEVNKGGEEKANPTSVLACYIFSNPLKPPGKECVFVLPEDYREGLTYFDYLKWYKPTEVFDREDTA